MNNDQLWQAILGEIELNLSKANFTTWFKNTFISSFEDNKVVICVPNTFTKAWLEKKYHKEIAQALKNVSDKEVDKIFYKVEIRKAGPMGELLKKIKIKKDFPSEGPATINRFGLNLRYTFNNFIVGEAPFQIMSFLGGMNFMRGYYMGRFRDNNAIILQGEYRADIWWRFGAVAFASVGEVAHKIDHFKLSDFKVTYGLGIRFAIDPKERLNFRLDFAWAEDSTGFYFTVVEAF